MVSIMRSTPMFIVFVCAIFIVGSCGNRNAEKLPMHDTVPASIKRDTLNPAKEDTIRVLTITHGPDYYFEPHIAVVAGTLRTELYYGPPNFGEDSTEKPTENYYIFYSQDTINVIQRRQLKENEEEYDQTTLGVYRFQLAPMGDLSLHKLVNKKIKITGSFYGGFNGHHVTDVLMAVNAAEEVKSP